MYQMTRTHNHYCQTRHQRKKIVIRRKSVKNTGKMTRQTHHQASILISPMTVIADSSNVRRGDIGKKIRSNYAQV